MSTCSIEVYCNEQVTHLCRQKTLNEVRSECLEVWELFRESVQALRKGVLFLEERVAIVKKEVSVN